MLRRPGGQTIFNTASGYNNPDNIIYNIQVTDDKVYAQGAFANIGSTAASQTVALDKNKALVDSDYNPGTISGGTRIYNSSISGSEFYLTGDFTSVSGTSRLRLAKVNPTTGVLDGTFNLSTGPSADVKVIVPIDATYAIAVGSFLTYKGSNRRRSVKLNKSTGAIEGTYNANGGGTNGPGPYDAIYDGFWLHICGDFDSYNANDGSLTPFYCGGIAGVKAAAGQTGTMDRSYYNGKSVGSSPGRDSTHGAWIARTGAKGVIYSICFGETVVAAGTSDLYIGGSFDRWHGGVKKGIAKIYSNVNGTADATFDTSVGISGNTYTVYKVIYDDINNVVYAGGNFTHYNGVARSALVKLDGSTAVLDENFDAGFTSEATIRALYLDGNYLYAGGSFSTCQNRAGFANDIVKLDAKTGKLL